jgi:hypothetical protein
MKSMNTFLAISFILVAFVVGLAGGYFITPDYQRTMYENEQMGFGKADRFVDLRYIDQMAAHHKGAMLLAAQIEDKTDRPELKKLADDIQVGEPKLIAELYSWKKEWYNDTRPAVDPVVANLGGKDENSDLRFLNALIAHHEDGIEMTKEIRTKSSRAEVLTNADAVEQFLSQSLIKLREWRKNWYNVE